MSVHIHLSVADLFKMAAANAANADGVAAAAASDAAAAARVAQEATHQEELKELRQLIEKQKMEITHLKWDSFAAAAKERNAFDEQTKDLTDRLNEAEELSRQQKEEFERANARADNLRKALLRKNKAYIDLTAKLRDAEEHTGELLQNLELSETSNSRATERALRAEELVRQQKGELERANARAEEVACYRKEAWNELADKFDTSTTFYRMKLEEAEEIRERLEKQLKEEGEALEEVSRRECALGQRVREANLCAEKAEANFLRLCASIDIALKAYPLSRKELWAQYMSTAPSFEAGGA